MDRASVIQAIQALRPDWGEGRDHIVAEDGSVIMLHPGLPPLTREEITAKRAEILAREDAESTRRAALLALRDGSGAMTAAQLTTALRIASAAIAALEARLAALEGR